MRKRMLGAGLAVALSAACGTSTASERGAGEHSDRDHEGHAHLPGSNGSRVQMSPAALARAGVRIEEVTLTALGGRISVPAEVRPDPDRVVHLAPLVEGQVAEARASVGDRVEEGEVVAVLNSIALGETRAALAEAQAALDVAQANYQRQRELVDQGIGARRQLVEAEGALATARARLSGLRRRLAVYGQGGSGSTTLLRSPIAGEVVERHATVGEVVRPDQTLFVITDTSVVWVVGSVYPQDVASLEKGRDVRFTAPDLPGRSWQGSLDWISPVLDEETRTLPVRLVIQNADGALRPGLFGTLRVAASPAERAGETRVPTIATSALTELDGTPVVFVPGTGESEFEVRVVRTGRQEEGRAEVLEGLSPGEHYVAQGTFVLKSRLLSARLGEGHAH